MELETERLILREYVSEDWEAVLAYHSDPLYQRFYPMSDRSVDEAKDFIQMFLDHQKQQPRIKFQLVVTLKPGRQLISNCGIRLDSPDAHQADLGYELAPDYWGQGYATEAARAMLN
jgi:RimJ/RimL family protein N-acetyltransferase